jgi:D-serine deaminase-like pyridoxal phosphate-dependent protein
MQVRDSNSRSTDPAAGQDTGVSPYELDTPCVVVDLDRLDRNILRMAQLASDAGVSLRPHAKTHKLVPVAERQIAAGSEGLTVAKLSEAELFAGHGITDLFIAYPIWGPTKWERLCRLAADARLRVGADSFEVFKGISDAATAHGLTIPIRIEIDTGFGRCGVQTAEEAGSLARQVAPLRGVRLVGVMSFAGQTYDVGPAGVRDAALADARSLVEIADALRADGFEIREVSVGGTPSASYVSALEGITEIRPGTYVFSDRDQAALGWGGVDDCALTVMATVVSRPTPTRAVIDAGSKTLSSDRAVNAEGWGVLRDRPDWTITSLYEEHALLEVSAEDAAPIGTVVEIIPNHACGTLNMHDWVAAAREGEVEAWWRVDGRGLVR